MADEDNHYRLFTTPISQRGESPVDGDSLDLEVAATKNGFGPGATLAWRFGEQVVWSVAGVTIELEEAQPKSELELLAGALGTNRADRRGWKKNGKKKGKRDTWKTDKVRKP